MAECKYAAQCGNVATMESMKIMGDPNYPDCKEYYEKVCMREGKGCPDIKWLAKDSEKQKIEEVVKE